jgi:predicted transcriptional regulator
MKLAELMERHLISVRSLAKGADLAESTIRRMLEGSNVPRTDTKSKVLEALNQILRRKGGRTLEPEEVFGKPASQRPSRPRSRR